MDQENGKQPTMPLTLAIYFYLILKQNANYQTTHHHILDLRTQDGVKIASHHDIICVNCAGNSRNAYALITEFVECGGTANCNTTQLLLEQTAIEEHPRTEEVQREG